MIKTYYMVVNTNDEYFNFDTTVWDFTSIPNVTEHNGLADVVAHDHKGSYKLVLKTKLPEYVLPMDDTNYESVAMHCEVQNYAVKEDGRWRPDATASGDRDAQKSGYTVTNVDLDGAPDWVKALRHVEV